LDPTSAGKQGTVMIRGGFRIALSFPVWVFRTFDGLSAGFMIVYLFLVFVKYLAIGRFPPSSMRESVSHDRRYRTHTATYLTYHHARIIKHRPIKPPITAPTIAPTFPRFCEPGLLPPVASIKAVVGTYTWDGFGVTTVRIDVVVT